MDEAWERKTIKEILTSYVVEQRRKRRWGIFIKLLIIGYIFAVTFAWIYVDRLGFSLAKIPTLEHTGVVNIEGTIATNEAAGADKVIKAVNDAFKAVNCKGLILRINSPGGSPVQARQIFNEIKRLKQQDPDFPIYAAVEDLATSGAYLVASAADQIYADETSLLGSIGVAFSSFGATGALEKLGLERRLYIAGEHKGILDPFLPANPQDVAFIKNSLDEVHQFFIDNVKLGRGTRLQEFPELYSGLFWTGAQSKKIGLIDEFGDTHYIAREVFAAPKLIVYSVEESLFERLSKKFGISLGGWLSPLQ